MLFHNFEGLYFNVKYQYVKYAVCSNCTKCGSGSWSTYDPECSNCAEGCKSSCSNCAGAGCDAACSHDCDSSCKGSCSGCSGTCKGSCSGGCKSGCKGSCDSGCSGTCTTSCAVACSQTCQTSCKDKCSTGCSSYCDKGCNTTSMSDIAQRLTNLTLETLIYARDVVDLKKLLLEEVERRNRVAYDYSKATPYNYYTDIKLTNIPIGTDYYAEFSLDISGGKVIGFRDKQGTTDQEYPVETIDYRYGYATILIDNVTYYVDSKHAFEHGPYVYKEDAYEGLEILVETAKALKNNLNTMDKAATSHEQGSITSKQIMLDYIRGALELYEENVVI